MREVARLVVLRHCESASVLMADDQRLPSDDDNDLTVAGHAAARRIGKRLVSVLPKHVEIISSPLVRSLATARHLATEFNRAASIDDRLGERRFLLPKGSTIADSRIYQMACYLDVHKADNGGESLAQQRIRVLEWLDDWRQSFELGVTAIIVTHGDVIEHLYGAIFQAPVSAMSESFMSCGTGRLHIWTILDRSSRDLVWRLDAANIDVDRSEQLQHLFSVLTGAEVSIS